MITNHDRVLVFSAFCFAIREKMSGLNPDISIINLAKQYVDNEMYDVPAEAWQEVYSWFNWDKIQIN